MLGESGHVRASDPEASESVMSLPDYVTAALEIMKLETQLREIAELDEHGQITDSRLHPETSDTPFTKRMGTVFGTSQFRFQDSVRINITVSRARRFDIHDVFTVIQATEFPGEPCKAPFLTISEKEEDMLERTGGAPSMNL